MEEKENQVRSRNIEEKMGERKGGRRERGTEADVELEMKVKFAVDVEAGVCMGD